MTADQIPVQLIACCELPLEAALFREDPQMTSKPDANILVTLKQLAVMRVALRTRRATLLQTGQAARTTASTYANMYPDSRPGTGQRLQVNEVGPM